MTTTFGVTPTGFVRKPLLQILSDVAAYQRANIDPNLKATSSDSAVGNINGALAREMSLLWEQLEICYNGYDPEAAEAHLLEMLAKLTGTARRAASRSTVTLSCNLNIGTVLLAGTHFAAILGQANVRWSPLANYTATATATVPITFQAENTGPIEAVATTISVIATPVVGWNSVTNTQDASPGRNIDDDPTLRLRRAQELAATGSATVRAIRAALLACSPQVLSVLVLENDTDLVSGGLPPHSVEGIVYDGAIPVVPDTLIAQTLWDKKGGGITAFGTSSALAVINDAGTTKPVAFSRPTVVPVYLAMTLQKLSTGYPGDAVMKQLIADQCNVFFGVGQNVIWSEIYSLPFMLQFNGLAAGIKKIVSLGLDIVASPVATADLVMTNIQIPRFDTSRINITST